MEESKELTKLDYAVGIVTFEMAPIVNLLDQRHANNHPDLQKHSKDYALGQIGKLNVVVACASSESSRSEYEEFVASQFESNFPLMSCVLIVRMDDGVPRNWINRIPKFQPKFLGFSRIWRMSALRTSALRTSVTLIRLDIDLSSDTNSFALVTNTLHMVEAHVSVQDVAGLLARDESLRASALRSLNSAKYKPGTGHLILEEEVGELLRQYSHELCRTCPMQVFLMANFVCNHCVGISESFLQLVKPPAELQQMTANESKEPVQPLLIERFVEDSATRGDSSKSRLAKQDGGEYLTTMLKGPQRSFSIEPLNDIKTLNDIEDFLPFPTRMFKDFLMSDEPIIRLRTNLQKLLPHEEPERSPSAAPKAAQDASVSFPPMILDRDADPEIRIVSSNEIPSEAIETLESGGYKVHWTCRCGKLFDSVIRDSNRQAALELYREMNWDTSIEGPYRFRWPDWLLQLGMIWQSVAASDLAPIDGSNPWASESIANEREDQNGHMVAEAMEPVQDIEHGIAASPTSPPLEDLANVPTIPESVFWCLCFPEKCQRRLHQVEMSSTTSSGSADQELFRAIRKAVIGRHRSTQTAQNSRSRIHKILSGFTMLWRSLKNPVSVSKIAYHEFYLDESKAVYLGDNGKLPCDDICNANEHSREVASPRGEEEELRQQWSWTCDKTVPNVKRYLGEERLLHHFLLDPSDIPSGDQKGARYWKWIPHKRNERLICTDDMTDEVGWGLAFEMEGNHGLFFLSFTLPVIVLALSISIPLTVLLRWPVSTGFALFAGILALDVFFYTIVQAVGKQRGLIK